MQYHYADGSGVPGAPFEFTDSNGKVIAGTTSQDGVFKVTNIGCGQYAVLFDEGEDEFTPQETFANNPVLQKNPEYAALATEYFTLYHYLKEKGLVGISSGGWTDWGQEDLSHDIESVMESDWLGRSTGNTKQGFTQQDVNAVKRFRELAERIEGDNGDLEAAIIKTHHQLAGEASDNSMVIMMVAEIILGCIPVVGQVMDVKDCAVWLYDGCTGAEGADFSDPLYLGMSALCFIGFVPGLGDAIKKSCTPILKFMRKTDDVGTAMRKIRNLSNGNLLKYLRELSGKIKTYADKAVKFVANIVEALGKLVRKVGDWLWGAAYRLLQKVNATAKKLVGWIQQAVNNIKQWIDDFIGKIFTKKTGTPMKKNQAQQTQTNAGADKDRALANNRKGDGGDASNTHNKQACCSTAGNPVRVTTGQVVDKAEDLVVPGLPDLRLARQYHPEARGGLFGRGWHSNLDVHLRVEDDGFWYVNEDFAEIQFYDPEPGKSQRNSHHPQQRLCRDDDSALFT